jgi:hypothetical protein
VSLLVRIFDMVSSLGTLGLEAEKPVESGDFRSSVIVGSYEASVIGCDVHDNNSTVSRLLPIIAASDSFRCSPVGMAAPVPAGETGGKAPILVEGDNFEVFGVCECHAVSFRTGLG